MLALVHRQDLALQQAETLNQEDLEVGLLMEGSHTLHTPVVVATVQSLTPEAIQDLLAANCAGCCSMRRTNEQEWTSYG